MIHVDNLAFLNAHGMSPDVNEEIGLDMAHVTSAAPFFSQTEQILNGGVAPNGRRVMGINDFRTHLEEHTWKSKVLRSSRRPTIWLP